jgi:TonB family protein
MTRAYVSSMKSDLRNLVTAEEAYFADSVRYTTRLGPLYAVTTGNAMPTITLTADGWTATIENLHVPYRCAIFVGSTPRAPARREGEPVCQKQSDLKESSRRLPEDRSGTEIRSESDQVYMESVVEERPELVSGPQLEYPDLLRQAGIQGRVLVQAIIDTTGRAEPQSVNVIQSPNPGFDQPSTDYVLRALFRPARVHGRPVRVLLNLPIDFKIKR